MLASLASTIVADVALDPKRKTGAGGVDAWYPYYAGFSSTFARRILESLPRDLNVLDPWNGSGTSTYVASALGFSAVGIDLNPFAFIIATAKCARFSSISQACSLALSLAATPSCIDLSPDDPLLSWLPETATRSYRSIDRAIQGKESISPAHAAFAQLCLIRAARELAKPRRLSNPTWCRPGAILRVPGARLAEHFVSTACTLAADATTSPISYPSLLIADSRSLPLPDADADVILTSPPYCTRIDYAVQTSFELACIGVRPDFEFAALRRALMGTTSIREKVLQPLPTTWSRSVIALMNNVRRHHAYASGGYYYKNLWQYFDDAQRSVGELARVLRSGGIGLLVLQTSYYKEIYIDLPSLYVEIAQDAGLHSRVILDRSIPSSRVMTSVNTNSRRYLGSRSYKESLVLLEKK